MRRQLSDPKRMDCLGFYFWWPSANDQLLWKQPFGDGASVMSADSGGPSGATQRYVGNRGRSGSAGLALETTLMTQNVTLHPLIDAPRKVHSITPSARAAVKTPTLNHWTYFDLRRSFAPGLARLGVPLQVTELCLNHKSGVSNKPLVRIYQQHDYAAEVKAAFEKWSVHVEALIAAKVKAAAWPVA